MFGIMNINKDRQNTKPITQENIHDQNISIKIKKKVFQCLKIKKKIISTWKDTVILFINILNCIYLK